MRRSRAFSIIEFMVAMVIMFLIGGTAITSFWIFWSAYQTDRDYVEAREEMEFTFQLIGRDFTNISLGMPNNKAGSGDFSETFRGATSNDSPIMHFMGRAGESWGGPIMLRWHPSGGPDYFDESHVVKNTVTLGSNDVYIGDELMYATAIPALTGSGTNRSVLKVDKTNVGKFNNGNNLVFPIIQTGGVDTLVGYRDEGRLAGIVAGNTTQRSARAWVVLPGLQIPLRVNGWVTGSGTSVGNSSSATNNTLTLSIAPFSTLEHVGMLGGFEEIHLVKAARVFVNSNHQLVQEIYGDNFNDAPTAETATSSTLRLLAENVAGVVFIFDPSGRALTMHIATMGAEVHPERGAAHTQPATWPVVDGNPTVNNKIALSGDVLQRRLVVGSRTWRIRN